MLEKLLHENVCGMGEIAKAICEKNCLQEICRQEPYYKPGSVFDDHLSGPDVAIRL